MTAPTPPADPAGQPTEPAKTPAGDPPAPKAPEAGDPPKDTKNDKPDEPLGEGGLKALKAEREAREALEKQIKALAPLQKIAEALGGGDPAKGKTEIEQITERMSQYETDLAEARRESMRLRIAGQHQISEDDANEFLTGADEATMARQAERLAALRGQPSTPATPKPDPSQGGRSGSGVDLDAQIAEAQKNGEWRRVITLQNQKLANQSK